jgi:hypothetical protein
MEAASGWALDDALAVIRAKAQFDGKERPVFTRVAESDGNLFLDLGDSARRAVKITPLGWSMVSQPPVYFRRSDGMLALPMPVPGGHITDLRRFVNVTDADWILYVSWLIAAFRPRGPYPILALCGESGSAKTTAERVARHFIDPFTAPMRTPPRNEQDLMIAAINSHVITLDNLSNLSRRQSDALCRLSTGGGMATRRLFTDEEETIFEAQRPVLLNGIEEVATSGDLLDRMVVLSLPEITEDARKEDEVFWEELESVRPQILGALLDGVSSALKNFRTVKLEKKPRMADFAKWASAAECALGFEAGEFIREYDRNRKEAADIALESSPVATAVYEFMRDQPTWEGTNGALLTRLKDPRGRALPVTPKALSNSLVRAKSSLRNVGVIVHRLPREAGTGRRLIRLEKRSPAELLSSQSS